MDFFQSLGFSPTQISELSQGHTPSSDGFLLAASAAATAASGPSTAVISALTHVPQLPVIAEKFIRLERFCAVALRADIAPENIQETKVSGSYSGAMADLFQGALKLGCLKAMVAEAGFSAPALQLDLLGERLDFELTVENLVDIPELDSSGSAQIADHLLSLIAADPARGWRIDQASAHLGLTGRSLQRYLLAENTTFSKILRKARTDVACRLLEERDTTLAEIGFCCGYADQAHFQREFRKEIGVTPRKYRLGHRPE